MVVTAKPCVVSNNKAKIFLDGMSWEAEPDYYNKNQAHMALDLYTWCHMPLAVFRSCGNALIPVFHLTNGGHPALLSRADVLPVIFLRQTFTCEAAAGYAP